MSELPKVTVETANALYAEGGEYMKYRTLTLLRAEAERHRKGSSGRALIDSFITRILELPND